MKNVYLNRGDRSEDLNQGKETIQLQHCLLIPSEVICQSDKKRFKGCRKKNHTSPDKTKTKPKISNADSWYEKHAFTSIRLL